MRVPSLLTLCSAGLAVTAAAEPVISEFMASNQSGLKDENGGRPDWIELWNPDPEPVSLSGWALTDTASNLRKWVFPDVTLPPGGCLVVFASSLDRRVPGQNLHTSFSLSAGGEYLALVRPGGTVAMDWGRVYPPQYPDVSYGTALNTITETWVRPGSPVRAFVPSNTSLIPQWRSVAFDDSLWAAGTFGVGYMNAGASPNLSSSLGLDLGSGSATPMNNGTGRHSYTRAAFTLDAGARVAALTLRVNYDDGFVAWINGVPAAASAGAPVTDPIPPAALVSSHPPAGFEDFPVAPEALAALRGGRNILAVENMNSSTGSSDAIVIAELQGAVILPGTGQTGYFARSTPGAVNGGDSSLQLPAEVSCSRPPGTFTAPFELTLSGAGDGQEIRYVVSAPSAAGAALAEPLASSPLYTGPLTVDSSRLIRAAVFSGAQKGPTTTAQYLKLETGSSQNTSGFTSRLPILVMDDHGAGQPVDSASGLWTGTLLHLFTPENGVASLNAGGAGLFARSATRVRGSSSSEFPKKSYAFEFRNEQDRDTALPVLGLAADSDWILNGPYQFDDTYLHNAFISEVSRRIGRWAPRTRPVEVFFNQNGGKLDYQDYAGIYVLTEKIKSSAERLEMASLHPGDDTGAALTGGYLFKIDRPDAGEYAWSINNSRFGLGTLPYAESGQKLVLVEPGAGTAVQQDYLKNTAVLPWNNTLFTERAAAFTTRNYRDFIDTGSFVDHHLLNSLAYNVDALRLSAYYHKDREGKIHAGPVWDFDRALGSDDGRDANPASWNNIGYYFDRDWWNGLFRDPQFVQEVVDRWWELRQPGGAFATPQLHQLVSDMAAEIGPAAAARDAAKWPANAPAGGSYLNEIAALKTWIESRCQFLDSAAPHPPEASAASGPVAAGSGMTLSGSGTIRYTLDGSDPRPFGGAAPGSGSIYAAPLVISATTVLTARRQAAFTPFPGGAASIAWSAPLQRVWLVDEFFAAGDDLILSEINYHPLPPTPAEAAAVPGAAAEDFEWLELHNPGNRTVNTFGMTFPAENPFGKALSLAPVSLAPGAFALVVKNRAAFEARYGTALRTRIAGEWISGSLDNSGGEIRLLTRDGAEAFRVVYNDKGDWPDRADGAGSTLEFAPDTPVKWRASAELHGNPGSTGTGPDSRVVINEILTESTLPRVDAIELRNTSTAPVDISGWFLSDTSAPESALDYRKFAIPAGTVIAPGGYAVFTETDFHPNGPWNPQAGTPAPHEFSFDGRHGGQVHLLSRNGDTLRFIDGMELEPARPDESWGRPAGGSGPLVPLRQRTLLAENAPVTPWPGLGADNSGLRTGPVLIQEIHHAPSGDDNDLEFLELFNPSAQTVSLNGWKLRGEVDFLFSTEEIAAGGVLVVVPFAPSDTVRAEFFRNTYGVPASVALAGPWAGGAHLGKSGKITLYRAGAPAVEDPGFVPLTREDQSRYFGEAAPWPETTSGNSLNRERQGDGSSAASWGAAAPTPGTLAVRYGYWTSLHFPAGGPESSESADPDGDSLTNLIEFTFGTSPLTADAPAAVLPSVSTRPAAGGGGELVFTYRRPAGIPGTVCLVQQSVNLQTWTTVPDAPAGPDPETRAAVLPVIPGISSYLRLKVEVTP